MSFLLIQLLTGLSSAAVLFLVASGLSLIFGVTRILNFAHGSLYMLGAYISYSLVQWLGAESIGFWGSLLLAAGATAVIGAGIEMVILRRIYHVPELFQLLATFGILMIVQDITLHVWGPEDLLGPQAPGLDGAVQLLGESFPSYDLFLIALAVTVITFLYLLLYKTRWGVLVRAATEDREMLANLGVNQKWLFTSVFALGSFLAGLGGALQLPRESVSLSMDMNMIIDVFVVIVIGGLGSLRGTVLATIIVGVVRAFGILLFPEITLVLLFLIMATVLIFKPYGLFGRAEDTTTAPNPIADGAMRPSPRWAGYVGLAVGVVMLAMPLFVGDYGLVLTCEIMIWALFAASLHFIFGPGGVGVFGHALYFGLGAYAVALLTKYFAISMPLALVAAPMAAILGALIFGWFCVRSQGIYLAMLTFAFAQMVWAVCFQWYEVTGGDNGLLGIWPAPWASDKTAFYYLTFTLCGSGILLLRYFIFTPFGYALRAVRDQPKRAEALGLNGRRLQWMGMGLAGSFAGLAGALFAYSKGSVFPTSLDIHTTLNAMVMTLLGGLNTLSGPLVGSVIYIFLESEISRVSELWRLFLGLIILSIVIFFPQGIVGAFNKRFIKKTE
ncbi:MAG: ABC transporter permease [Bdellovibrionales bacterium]